MTKTRNELIARLWRGEDPLSNAPVLPKDAVGWPSSQHRYLTEAVSELRPRIIVEVGVWKGVSSIVMAHRAKQLGLDCALIAVDTWLGTVEQFRREPGCGAMQTLNGYPQIYFTFLSNLVHYDVAEFVVPVPLDSVNASVLAQKEGIQADIIHIDGGHDYLSVKHDLISWWPILAPGGVLLGDDYYTNGQWPGVRKAFDEHFESTVGVWRGQRAIEHDGGKCRLYKPRAYAQVNFT
jgi:methyltransferase family protein